MLLDAVLYFHRLFYFQSVFHELGTLRYVADALLHIALFIGSRCTAPHLYYVAFIRSGSTAAQWYYVAFIRSRCTAVHLYYVSIAETDAPLRHHHRRDCCTTTSAAKRYNVSIAALLTYTCTTSAAPAL
jgi:hypothetical protein